MTNKKTKAPVKQTVAALAREKCASAAAVAMSKAARLEVGRSPPRQGKCGVVAAER
jgi:hypothetical protein